MGQLLKEFLLDPVSDQTDVQVHPEEGNCRVLERVRAGVPDRKGLRV